MSITDPARYRQTMLSRAVILGAFCFIGGWALVFVSGYGGDSTGGSQLVWQAGGLMVYASLAILPITALAALATVLRSSARRLHRTR